MAYIQVWRNSTFDIWNTREFPYVVNMHKNLTVLGFHYYFIDIIKIV